MYTHTHTISCITYKGRQHFITVSFDQIIIDGRDTNAIDEDGFQLPTLVYMAREKRLNFPHHFKAGAMNALVSNTIIRS